MSSATKYLDQLLRRIKELTRTRGARKAMAMDLKIPPQKLNDWLSSRFNPSGEATLQLLRWVTAQELQRDGKMESVLNILIGGPSRKNAPRSKPVKKKQNRLSV